MQNVSAAFHAAIQDESPQRALIRFGDGTFFTGRDITASGIRFNLAVNENEELSIGSCCAGEAKLTVYNDDGLLDGYGYGEADISLGVRLTEGADAGAGGVCHLRYHGGLSDELNLYTRAGDNKLYKPLHVWGKYSVGSQEGNVPGQQMATAKIENYQTRCRYYRGSTPPYDSTAGTYSFSSAPLTEAYNIQVGDILPCGGAPMGLLEPTATSSVQYGVITAVSGQQSIMMSYSAYCRGSIPAKGSYIEDVTSTDPEAYPADGVKDGYWYVRQADASTTGHPDFPAVALLAEGSDLYAISAAGAVWKGTISAGDVTAAAVQPSINSFMTAKLSGFAGRGIELSGRSLTECSGGRISTWEYCPMGRYNLTAPRLRSIRVELTGLDAMEKFDADISDWWNSLTYPTTPGAILSGLCTACGVSWTATSFINSDMSITEAPMGASGLTGRKLLEWICEAACCYGRISRSGALELIWWSEITQGIPYSGQTDAEISDFEAAEIDRLHIITAQSDLGVLVPASGTDENEYQIVDNPLLYGADEAAIRTKGTPIYNRLAAMEAYRPLDITTCTGDWSLECGDIATVAIGTEAYELYIMRMELTWAAGCRIRFVSTGSETRLLANSATRELFDQSWRYFLMEKSIEGLTIEIGGKIDGQQCQTLIDASMEEFSVEVSSGSTGSTFKIKYNGVEISSQTLDLHVKSVNVDGTITADAINLNTATITGTLKASNIDATNLNLSNANIGTLQVGNANIGTLYARKIVGGATGGYVASGAISDSSHLLSNLYCISPHLEGVVDLVESEGSGHARISYFGVSAAGSGTFTSWADIIAGGTGTAKWG